jgi:hypothetical protein
MISLRVIAGNATAVPLPPSAALVPTFRAESLVVTGSGLRHRWTGTSGDSYFLFGDIVGFRQADGTLGPSALLKVEPERLEDIRRIPEVEGRFVLLRVAKEGGCEIWTDQFGRVDIYWQSIGGATVVATGLDLLPVALGGAAIDSVGAAHALTIYGSRPAKEHTLYRGVHRLGVSQGLRLASGIPEILRRPVKLASTVPQYVEQDLHRYADLFLEAIRARGSSAGNIVYLSSGWDSTSILAALVHLFGKRKVRAVIGRMRYSDRSGVINQFEIDRARAVADYYGVRLDIAELDYRKDAASTIERLRGAFRSQQFANLAGVNHWLLAEATAKTATGAETVFAGEMSDGAHNLGFSQFVSIFHPASLEFREYSDKMASYLFGPTFLGQLCSGAHDQDPVWQLYKQRNGNIKFDKVAAGNVEITKQLVASFFLRAGRMPLYSLDNTRLLTAEGRATYGRESERVYINDICAQVTPETLYACYLHLYNSFHWQGATVSTLEHTAELHGLRCVLPFHDGGVIEFLSAMPESWGRGLDLKPTKYPLKWMLRNRIDYPHHLQTGPHSYTYDVDPNFTLIGEILHASSFKPVFTDALREGRFVASLDPGMFDRSYIDNEVIQPFLSGAELRGQEMNDLAALAMHATIGIYGA